MPGCMRQNSCGQVAENGWNKDVMVDWEPEIRIACNNGTNLVQNVH